MGKVASKRERWRSGLVFTKVKVKGMEWREGREMQHGCQCSVRNVVFVFLELPRLMTACCVCPRNPFGQPGVYTLVQEVTRNGRVIQQLVVHLTARPQTTDWAMIDDWLITADPRPTTVRSLSRLLLSLEWGVASVIAKSINSLMPPSYWPSGSAPQRRDSSVNVSDSSIEHVHVYDSRALPRPATVLAALMSALIGCRCGNRMEKGFERIEDGKYLKWI